MNIKNNQKVITILIATSALTACEQQSGSGSLAFPTAQKTAQPEVSPKATVSRSGTTGFSGTSGIDSSQSEIEEDLAESTTDCSLNPNGACVSKKPAKNQHLTFDGAKWVPSNFVATENAGSFSVTGNGLSFTNNVLSLDAAGLTASSTQPGFLSKTDWNTFNSCLKTPETLGTPDRIVGVDASNQSISLALPSTNGSFLLQKTATGFSFTPYVASLNTGSSGTGSALPAPSAANQVLTTNTGGAPTWSTPTTPQSGATSFFGFNGTNLGWFTPPAGGGTTTTTTTAQLPYLPPLIRFTQKLYESDSELYYFVSNSRNETTDLSALNTECNVFDSDYIAANILEVVLNYKVNRGTSMRGYTHALKKPDGIILGSSQTQKWPLASIDTNNSISPDNATDSLSYPIACIHKLAPLRVFNTANGLSSTPSCPSGYSFASNSDISAYGGSGYNGSYQNDQKMLVFTSDSLDSGVLKKTYYLGSSGPTLNAQISDATPYSVVCLRK